MTDILRIISEERIRIHQIQIKPRQLAELVDLLADDVINSKIAKQIFPQLFLGHSAKEIVEKEGLAQVSDTSLIERLVSEIVNNNPDSVQQYKNGKTKLFGFFVGQVLKETQGQANPKVINDILRKKLEEV
jgi:aspartyl-tRNA(Asn)/glutamyl-tRNA(Gln) amidotransferase subunit B